MNTKQSIKQLANQCVKCGVCAPVCPTYVKTQHEGESARGRIALMEALAADKLPLSTTLLSHLDSCLGCRSCEAVCPSQVSYAKLLNVTHQLIAEQKPGSPWIDFVFSYPKRIKLIARFLRFYQTSGLQWLVRKSKILNLLTLSRWDNYLPIITLRSWKKYYSATTKKEVSLYTGCISQLVEAGTVQAAILLLNAWGFAVNLPKNQACCGALHLREGSGKFTELAQQNIHQFNHLNHPILFLASGCGMTLRDYPKTLPQFTQPLYDVPSFLIQHAPEQPIQFKSLNAKIAIHTPCSVKNSLKTEDAVYKLLQLIPDINLIPIVTPTRCCGAGGTNMLTQPKMADELAADILDVLQEIKPDYLITSNVGCRIHLEAQLRIKGLDIKIMHPVELLASCLT